MASPSARRPSFLGSLFALAGLVILIWLGQWQLQRLKWKEDLLTHIAALKTEPARPVEDALQGSNIDFVRVSIDCPHLMTRPRLKLYGVQDGMVGYRQMVACPIAAGNASSVLVDLGFAPDRSTPCVRDKPIAPWTGPAIGILRLPDPKTFATLPNQPADNLWYSRDLPAMAAALNAGSPAPAFIALEHGPELNDASCPLIRAPIPADIPNNHLAYALTWFGLALALAAVYVANLFRKRPD